MHKNILWEIMSPVNVNLIWPSSNSVDATQKQEYSFVRVLLRTHNLAEHILMTI